MYRDYPRHLHGHFTHNNVHKLAKEKLKEKEYMYASHNIHDWVENGITFGKFGEEKANQIEKHSSYG